MYFWVLCNGKKMSFIGHGHVSYLVKKENNVHKSPSRPS